MVDKSYSTGVMNQLKVSCDDLFFVHIKRSYYLFNRKELLQKAKDRYHNSGGKEKAAEYYLKNRGGKVGGVKQKNNKYSNLSEEKKEAKREYQRNRNRNMKEKINQKSIKQLKY